MRVKFFPVLGPATYLHHYTNSKDKFFEWWNAVDKDYYVPRICLTYAYHGERLPDVRKMLNCSPDVEVMCDSGGYEIYKSGLDVDPHAVIQWQYRNADLAFILDVPPKTEELLRGDDTTFKPSLTKTRRNVEVYVNWLEENGAESFKLYSVIHGVVDRGQFEEWFEEIHEPYSDVFSGSSYSVAGQHITLTEVTRRAVFLRERGIKKLHLLGAGGYAKIALAVVLSRYFDEVSFDCSDPLMRSSRYASYIIPLNYVELDIGVRGERRRSLDLSDPPCFCDACNEARRRGLNLSVLRDSLKSGFISLHHIYLYKQLIKVCEFMVRNDLLEELVKVLPVKDSVKKEFNRCLDLLERGEVSLSHYF